MRKLTKATVAGVSVLALAGAVAPIANADDTTTTVTITAGELKLVDTTSSIAFGSVAPGARGTGKLATTVDDQRASADAWNVAVSGTDLTSSGNKKISVTKLDLAGDTISTNSGTVTATQHNATPQAFYDNAGGMNAANGIPTGNNNVTVVSNIGLNVPSDAINTGTAYTGTITTSVS